MGFDLPFQAGDIITVTRENNGDWWSGRCKGKDGLFPSSYVERLPGDTSGPTSTSSESPLTRAPSTTSTYQYEYRSPSPSFPDPALSSAHSTPSYPVWQGPGYAPVYAHNHQRHTAPQHAGHDSAIYGHPPGQGDRLARQISSSRIADPATQNAAFAGGERTRIRMIRDCLTEVEQGAE